MSATNTDVITKLANRNIHHVILLFLFIIQVNVEKKIFSTYGNVLIK